ncbi:hypothetical protein N7373_08470 [Achromobacter mucicolens]|uniref:hypothetical protein n=1 Tax=Achromobacter mucicolens TaxID=1389922 RepID=UPI00244B170D|nr:hypothetical protein [Achromobacter mucicolens]MDH0091476.1 hypothetical protein [Achromobacter mucicolens]
MDEHKQSQSGPDNPTTEVEAIADFDYVTVVGCSVPRIFDSWSARDVASNVWNGQAGDKVWFINHGIRQLQQYPKGTPDYSIQRVFLMFTEQYPRKLLDEVKSIVVGMYGASYRELTSISGLIDFVQMRLKKQRRIKQMDFYAHGVVHSVEFGYETGSKTQAELRFGPAQARMMNELAFDDEARIFSYACRTGLGLDVGDRLDPGEDPKYNESLAQVLADAADVRVDAFPRRTSYENTFGTSSDRKAALETQRKMEQYKQAQEQYFRLIALYRQRVKTSDNARIESVSDEPPPEAPVKPYSEEEEMLVIQMQERDKYSQDSELKVPLDKYGAVRPVGSGKTPEGLPMGLKAFSPMEHG